MKRGVKANIQMIMIYIINLANQAILLEVARCTKLTIKTVKVGGDKEKRRDQVLGFKKGVNEK